MPDNYNDDDDGDARHDDDDDGEDVDDKCRLPTFKGKVKCLQVVAMVGLVDDGHEDIGNNYYDEDDNYDDDGCDDSHHTHRY